MHARERGAAGEQLAAGHYRRDGYEILASNYRTRFGEVDIIARKGDILVFSEVKARGEGSIAEPREWVNRGKQQRILQAARQYLAHSGLSELFIRFDVVEVKFSKAAPPVLNRIENAFTL